MKIYITILFFLICQSTSFAQNIPLDSFYRDGATWTQSLYALYQPTGHTIYNDWVGYSLKIQGDSIIYGTDTIKYKLLHYKYLGEFDSVYDTWNGNNNYYHYAENNYHYIGRIRVLGKKVYFTPEIAPASQYWQFGKEELIYDFGLNLYDSVYFWGGCNTIINIDSFQLASSIYIDRYKVKSYPSCSGGYGYFYYLFGIGSYSGFVPIFSLVLWGPPGYSESLLCYDNNELSYSIPDYTIPRNLGLNCFNTNDLILNNVIKTNQEINIYPNPLSGNELNIQSDDNSLIEKVEVIDMIGKVKYSATKPFKNSNDDKLNLPIESGVYFIKITSGDENIIVKRFVKL